MKIENEYYVLKQETDDGTLYLTKGYIFDNDIREALRAKNKITAQYIKCDFFKKYQCDLEIVPLKITYEW
jgi:hypothetical protein